MKIACVSRWISVAALLFCALLFCRPSPVLAQTGKPRAVVQDSVFEYGAVPQGSKVQYDFTLRNEGDADLVIQRLVPSCGCTAASASADAVKPGMESKIHVEFDTTGFAGEKLKTIRVYTNDLESSALLLTLKGTIEPDVSLEPSRLVFPEVVRGSPEDKNTQNVTVKVTRPQSEARITGVKTFAKYLIVKEINTGDRERTFSVTVDSSAPAGEIRDRIAVSLAGSKASGINLPVLAVVKGQLVLKPSQLSFGVLEGDAEMVRSVRFENMGIAPVAIKEIRSDNSAVTAKYKEIKPGREFAIEVRVDPRQVNRDLKAAVEILTDNSDEQTVLLNVYGILPPRT